MKKACTALLLFILVATAAKAQIGFEGGLNLANLAIKSAGNKESTKFLVSESVGIVGDIRLSGQHVYFEPGIYYKGAGCVIQGPPEEDVLYTTASMNLNVEYKTGEKCGNRFFVGIGPFISLNNFGVYNSAEYGGTNLQQYDFGPAINAGYLKRKHLYIRFSYQLGLVNLLTDGDKNNSVKTSAIGVTLGYLIGACRERGFRGGGGHSNNHWRGLRKNHYSTRERNYNPKWLY